MYVADRFLIYELRFTVKRLILIIFLLIFSKIDAQNKELPKFQLFSKHSVGFNSPSTSNLILDNEVSLYINSFGNAIECDSSMSFGGCLLLNLISVFSAYEITAGFDTHFENSAIYLRPKVGAYLRPFYFAKIGATFSTKNHTFSAGFIFPIKGIILEFLFHEGFSYDNTSYGQPSRYQLGIMIPLR